MSTNFDYLRFTMQQLSNILYNTSQSNYECNSKDKVLDSIKRIIENFNEKVEEKYKIKIEDFRKL